MKRIAVIVNGKLKQVITNGVYQTIKTLNRDRVHQQHSSLSVWQKLQVKRIRRLKRKPV